MTMMKSKINDKYKVDPAVRKFHEETIIADLHADTWMWEAFLGYNIRKRHRSFIPRNPFFNHIDVPRAREGGLNITGQGVVVNTLRKRNYLQRGKNMTERILRGIERNSDELELVTSATHAREAVSRDKIGVFLGVEGAHILEGKLEALDYFYNQGVSYFTLGHFNENEAVFTSNDLPNVAKSLKPFGKELVRKLEKKKIMVDIAHVAPGCVRDIMEIVTRPVIASHIGMKGVFDHWRNLDDGQLRAVAESGGVIGIMFQPHFLTNKFWRCELDTVVAHIEHCLEVAGEDHVALGSDFDGLITTPDGLTDISKLPILTQRLFHRGHSSRVLRKFLGENFLRVFKQVCGSEEEISEKKTVN